MPKYSSPGGHNGWWVEKQLWASSHGWGLKEKMLSIIVCGSTSVHTTGIWNSVLNEKHYWVTCWFLNYAFRIEKAMYTNTAAITPEKYYCNKCINYEHIISVHKPSPFAFYLFLFNRIFFCLRKSCIENVRHSENSTKLWYAMDEQSIIAIWQNRVR